MRMANKQFYLTPEYIAELCLEKYRKLPNTGKPTDTQWTVLAGIVLHDAVKKCSKVISLGLGTKCIGASKMCKQGLIINDSHAEVLARRGFVRYLYYQMKKLSQCDVDSIMEWDEQTSRYAVKSEYSFHFYSSKSPCGDASIIGKATELMPPKRQKLLDNVLEENEDIGQMLSSNVIYTGAKIFGNSEPIDCMIQTFGALRIKPGKGDRTLSMSCSDKLSKWSFLGVQGALLDVLLGHAIFFSSFNFDNKCNLDALRRATFERWRSKLKNFNFLKYQRLEPIVRICPSSKVFECTQSGKRQQPSPNGLVWCDIPDQFKSCEILVNGKRQGCTKKVLKTSQAALNISKYRFLEDFIDILSRNDDILKRLSLKKSELTLLQYGNAKQMATSYQEAWSFLKAEVFGQWTTKPENFLDFSLNNLQ